MIPELTRDQVLAAVATMLEEGVPRNRRSHKFCLVHEGRHFPPKYVVSLACRAYYPGGLPSEDFTGGAPTNTVLEALGFQTVACDCGGIEAADPTEAAPVVITACVQGDDDRTSHRLKLLETMLQTIRRASPASFLLLLPAGYVGAWGNPNKLISRAADRVSQLLAGAPAGSAVCLGVDGRRGRDQLAVAITAGGITAIARKFFPTDGERDWITPAASPLAPEQGYPRTFSFAGRRFYLAVCYDGFGIKKRRVPAPNVDAVLDLVHGFGPDGSGAGYFARYGFAGAAKAWGCPVFGAAVFEGAIQPSWPTAVVWNQGELPGLKWSYHHNPIRRDVVLAAEHGSELAQLSVYDLELVLSADEQVQTSD